MILNPRLSTYIPVLCCFLLLAGCRKQEGTTSIHSCPVKLADYLYEITYTDYDPGMSERYGRSMDSYSLGGACSVVRSGDIVARNYDFLYSDIAEFVIRVTAAPGRYASIGVAGPLFELTSKNAESDTNSLYYDILPYLTVDGINEKGVFCEVNMVVTESDYCTTGTKPDAKVTLYASQVVRYVLDHCSTAARACEDLKQMNIVFNKILGELHFMIADKTDTYVVEVIDNKLVCSKPKENILTNFYVLTPEFLNDDKVGLKPVGIERYLIARNRSDDCASTEGAVALMKDLRYSKIYDLSSTPYFYSEFYGDVYKGRQIDINTPKEDYIDYIKADIDLFKKGRRNYLDGLWITTHTSIYDLSDFSMRVYSQEDFDNSIDIAL